MNFFRHFPVILIGCALVACGGGKSTPAVNPSVNAPGAKVSPKAPELTPAPEPPPSQEQKMYMDNAVDRYSYALGVDFGRAVSNINVPVKLDVLIEGISEMFRHLPIGVSADGLVA